VVRDLARRVAWVYALAVVGGIVLLAAVILAQNVYDALRDWWRRRARRRS